MYCISYSCVDSLYSVGKCTDIGGNSHIFSTPHPSSQALAHRDKGGDHPDVSSECQQKLLAQLHLDFSLGNPKGWIAQASAWIPDTRAEFNLSCRPLFYVSFRGLTSKNALSFLLMSFRSWLKLAGTANSLVLPTRTFLIPKKAIYVTF